MNKVMLFDTEQKVVFGDGTTMPVGEFYQWAKEPTVLVVVTNKFTNIRTTTAEMSDKTRRISATSYYKHYIDDATNSTFIYAIARELVDESFKLCPMCRGVLPYESLVMEYGKQVGKSSFIGAERLGDVYLLTIVVNNICMVSRVFDVASTHDPVKEFSYLISAYRGKTGSLPQFCVTNIKEWAEAIGAQGTQHGLKYELIAGSLLDSVSDIDADALFYSASYQQEQADARQRRTAMGLIAAGALLCVLGGIGSGSLYFLKEGRLEEIRLQQRAISELDGKLQGVQAEIATLKAAPAAQAQQVAVSQPSEDMNMKLGVYAAAAVRSAFVGRLGQVVCEPAGTRGVSVSFSGMSTMSDFSPPAAYDRYEKNLSDALARAGLGSTQLTRTGKSYSGTAAMSVDDVPAPATGVRR